VTRFEAIQTVIEIGLASAEALEMRNLPQKDREQGHMCCSHLRPKMHREVLQHHSELVGQRNRLFCASVISRGLICALIQVSESEESTCGCRIGTSKATLWPRSGTGVT
jgi:hypothetical protein